MNLVLKVLLLSAGLSVAIKYLAPSLNIPVTSTNALIAVLLPSLVMAMLLIWRGQQSSSKKEIN
jgi:hypothetical protein